MTVKQKTGPKPLPLHLRSKVHTVTIYPADLAWVKSQGLSTSKLLRGVINQLRDSIDNSKANKPSQQ
jgi:hypothetical protein